LHVVALNREGMNKQESPANAKGTRDSSACMKHRTRIHERIKLELKLYNIYGNSESRF